MAFRFLHTADWQLGKSFGRFEGDLQGELKAARRDCISRIAALAEARSIDHVVVAGDVWDSEYPQPSALSQPLDLMASAGAVHWWLMPGNHDLHKDGALWTRVARKAPENVHLLLDPVPVPIGDAACWLPAPWTTRAPGADLTDWMDHADTDPGLIRIGVAHGGVKAFGSDQVTIAADRARTARLDYLALGDWHGMQQVDERTWYSGTPEPDRFVNNDRGHVLEVEIEKPGAMPEVTSHLTRKFDWPVIVHEVQSRADFPALQAVLLGEGAPTERLAKLTVTGRLTLSERSDLDGLLEDLGGRLQYLDADLAGLQTLVTPDDLDALDTQGSVRRAAEMLQTRMDSAGDDTSDAVDARRALEFLFSYARDAEAGAA